MYNNKFKKVFCEKWIEKKCKFMDNPNLCSFAHGENDKIKNDCLNGNNCYNENCIYKHSNDWNPHNNKKECMICSKGFCNKKNNKYKHIENVETTIKENDGNKVVFKLPQTEDFPELIKS